MQLYTCKHNINEVTTALIEFICCNSVQWRQHLTNMNEGQLMLQRQITWKLGADYPAVNDHAHLQMLYRAILLPAFQAD